MFTLHFKYLSILLAISLLALTQISSRALDLPLISVNRTPIIDEFETPRTNSTANDTVNYNDFASAPRIAKRPFVFTRNGLDAARKTKSYTFRSTRGSPMGRVPWTQSEIGNKTENPIHAGTILRKQLGVRYKYPNNENNGYYSNVVENEQQSQDYESDYYSEDNYHTMSDDQSSSNFENLERDPWRISYSLPNTGYFLPSMSTSSINDNYPVMLRGCDCPSRSTRSHECGNPSNTFLNLVFILGQNVWTLIRLIVSSSVPFIIPFVLLKLIIIPLKILKFIKLIKLFFKFFVVLPFLLRFIIPAFSNTFNLSNFLFQNLLGIPLSYSDPRQSHAHDNDDNIDSWNSTNTSSAFEKEINWSNGDMWDLRSCPSRLACELGAFLSTPSDTFALQRIANYLLKVAGWMKVKNMNADTVDNKEFTENINANRDEQKTEVLKAFLIALSKSWEKDKCEIYDCAMFFEK
ncbi:PREDICTED: uncharacterized protein LOC105362375 [Ceratosolen solmsi marchali]|uniref:Uncharacterized protein LOC105362375 n=1 Tax=Ceratosolen solmsi marchali TaxID=326594 RepID=A0AAJ6YHG6_9HYME|nr:PREDICTED: uncharacterized protein LOC105362375 [Ceratosolen solmsi marchali]